MEKILFINNTSYNFYNFRLPLLRALKEKGYEVILSASEDEYTQYLKREFPFYTLKELDRKGINPLEDLRFLFELLRLIKKIQPSLVVNITIKPNIWGNLASAFLKVPSVGIITGLGYTFTDKKFPIYQTVKVLYKIALKHPKVVIFQNLDDAELFVRENLVSSFKVRVIPGSGVDTGFFKPSNVTNKKKSNLTVFGYIGRLLWDKGIGELIEATKILKEKGYQFEVWILGKPDEGNPNSIPLQKLKEWEKQGLITYKGFSKDVRPFLEEIDCFVYPSYYREGLPRAVLEAMAMEKPIITTDAPGCKETVKEGFNGFLVKPKDAISLAQAMERFLKLPLKKVKTMGVFSRKLVEKKFSTKIVNKLYLETIEEVLNGT